MKKGNRGFTLIELIVCIVILMAIAGIFSINFIKNLNNTKDSEYKDIISRIESSADAYVTTYKDSSDSNFDDIKLVVDSDESFCYIPLEEIKSKGFLDDELINPKTGEEFKGVVKFTKEENGNYKFEYIEGATDYVTVVYEKNGADSVTRVAQSFLCENPNDRENLAKCVGSANLPSITRSGGNILGWSTDMNAKTSDYPASTSLSRLIANSDYKLVDNKLYLYAITNIEKSVKLDKSNIGISEVSNVKCTTYNNDGKCDVTLPSFTVPEYYEAVGWNTNINGTGDNIAMNSKSEVSSDITLYATMKLKDFDISVNRLNRVSSTTVTPSNINIILVLDVSSSMSSNSRLSNLKKVCKGLVERVNLDNSTVSLIKFNSSAQTVLTMSQNKSDIEDSIDSLKASGGTSFTTAISMANSLMSNFNNGKETYVIFVSDGISSINGTYSNLIELKSKTKIYSMGIGASSDNEYLKIIASGDNNFYNYDDNADDDNLSSFYSLFDDIVQNIIILEGDGKENAKSETVINGKLNLGNLVISNDYKVEIYLNDIFKDSFGFPNEYLYLDNGSYYFDVLNYSLANTDIGLANMQNLRIRFFYNVEERK